MSLVITVSVPVGPAASVAEVLEFARDDIATRTLSDGQGSILKIRGYIVGSWSVREVPDPSPNEKDASE